MRFLHTSDWHLGRGLHGNDLRQAQLLALHHLVDVAVDSRVDAVLVAGDVFDRAVPPLSALETYDAVLGRLVSAGIPVIVSSGNHDNPTRLGLNAGLLTAAGLHLRTRREQISDPVMLRDEHGPVAVYALPYLCPELVVNGVILAEKSHEATLRQAMTTVNDTQRALKQPRSVVMAHAWVTGGKASDSERDIAVGGLSNVPASVFDGASYVALGHLHGSQQLAPHIRYSGSPVAYSFSEARHVKGAWLVDLDAAGGVEATFVQTPVHRRIETLTGPLDDLLSNVNHAHAEDAFVKAVVTDAQRPLDLADRLRQRFPYLVVPEWAPAGGLPQRQATYAQRVEGRTARDITLAFIDEHRGRPADDAEIAVLDAAFAHGTERAHL